MAQALGVDVQADADGSAYLDRLMQVPVSPEGADMSAQATNLGMEEDEEEILVGGLGGSEVFNAYMTNVLIDDNRAKEQEFHFSDEGSSDDWNNDYGSDLDMPQEQPEGVSG